MKRLTIVGFLSFCTSLLFGQVTPLPNAHAHNDYEHEHPLYDALSHGFTSVEADVHLIDGELYVSHEKPAFKDQSKTLEALYLKPLRKIAQSNGGTIYPGYKGEFFLMIDIKYDGEGTYAVLKKQLEAYRDILTTYSNGKKQLRAVTIFLSGERPIETVKNDTQRLAAIDGRPPDAGQYDAAFMPVISDNYHNHFSWRGKGKPKPTQVARLQTWINAAHAKGQKVRLWASPEKESVWEKLMEIGVDLLNTDKLAELETFLLKRD